MEIFTATKIHMQLRNGMMMAEHILLRLSSASFFSFLKQLMRTYVSCCAFNVPNGERKRDRKKNYKITYDDYETAHEHTANASIRLLIKSNERRTRK